MELISGTSSHDPCPHKHNSSLKKSLKKSESQLALILFFENWKIENSLKIKN